MTRWVRVVLSLAALFAAGFVASAQTTIAPSEKAREQTAVADGTARVTLAEAAVPLYGPWKFTVGDSPIDAKTGKPLWAEPGFDDSKWETVDLTPKDGAFDPVAGLSGYVPGWTAKGHPGYWGYAWYRIRVQVQARPGAALALAGPSDVDDAYQVFNNGVLAGHFGDFNGSKPVVYYTQPKMFPLAQTSSRDTGTGSGEMSPTNLTEQTRVLAFRLWMEPYSLVNQPDSGGMHSAPVLGEASAVTAGYQTRWLELIRAYAFSAVQTLIFGLLAVVAFSLILFDRSDRVYLWMGALFLLLAAINALFLIGGWTEVQSIPTVNLLTDVCTSLLSAAWVMVFWVWFRLQRPAWLPRLTAGLTLLLMVSKILGDEVFFGLVPHAVDVQFVTVTLVLELLFFALLLWVVVEGIRRQGVEGWLVLPLVVLRGIRAFGTQLSLLHIPMVWFPFGAQFGLGDIASLLVAVAIALLLLRRLVRSVKRQRLMALDVKQAQEVQQVILPEARMALPGLVIESEYRPAREVGGDFFQIIPHASDGSVLIVAGDVAGKGLQAGMLVALLVGAVRMAAEVNPDPVFLLQALNRRLMGRGDAAATCLALHISAEGKVTLANAGHLPPYLNGEPVAMEGALPLGIFEGAEPSVMEFALEASDRLVLISDGILEATNEERELFGFERIAGLLEKDVSAAGLADAAQGFGQDDDISVISVVRVGVGV
jgi:Stage II sporulation protein E (SpoIIE)